MVANCALFIAMLAENEDISTTAEINITYVVKIAALQLFDYQII